MRKKLIVLMFAFAVALTACACSAPQSIEPSKYTISATLSADNVLTASVTCDYVNNTDVPLGELWFNLYPNAYREGAEYSPVPSNRITEAYPDGRSYGALDITAVSVNGKSVDAVIAGADKNVLTVALETALDPTDGVSVAIEYTFKLPKVKHRL